MYNAEMDLYLVDPYYMAELLTYIRLTEAAKAALIEADHPP